MATERSKAQAPRKTRFSRPLLLLDTEELGTLCDEVTEFSVPDGRHLVSLKLSFYDSAATYLAVRDGDVVELSIEANSDAGTLLGGYLRFRRGRPQPRLAHPGARLGAA